MPVFALVTSMVASPCQGEFVPLHATFKTMPKDQTLRQCLA